MHKTALSALLLSLTCLLALVGCKPSSDKASAPSAPPAKSATTPSAQTVAVPQATNALQVTASPMNPGLWEITMQSDHMKQQPQISPQQAAQIKKMGMNVPEMRNGSMVMKVCYTKEMLAKSEVPATNEQECKPTSMSKSGDNFSGQVVCNGPNMKGTGTIQGTMTTTSFQLTNSFNGTMGDQPVNHKTQTSGAFINSNCGDVKPIGTR